MNVKYNIKFKNIIIIKCFVNSKNLIKLMY